MGKGSSVKLYVMGGYKVEIHVVGWGVLLKILGNIYGDHPLATLHGGRVFCNIFSKKCLKSHFFAFGVEWGLVRFKFLRQLGTLTTFLIAG